MNQKFKNSLKHNECQLKWCLGTENVNTDVGLKTGQNVYFMISVGFDPNLCAYFCFYDGLHIYHPYIGIITFIFTNFRYRKCETNMQN